MEMHHRYCALRSRPHFKSEHHAWKRLEVKTSAHKEKFFAIKKNVVNAKAGNALILTYKVKSPHRSDSPLNSMIIKIVNRSSDG